MSDSQPENINQSSPNGFSIHTETIAKGSFKSQNKNMV